jgi:2-polyprenyl-6-methoxyphenol hydroxylase-like FAD-dependent oxidoreductase
MQVAIVGSGNVGQALAQALDRAGHQINLRRKAPGGRKR